MMVIDSKKGIIGGNTIIWLILILALGAAMAYVFWKVGNAFKP